MVSGSVLDLGAFTSDGADGGNWISPEGCVLVSWYSIIPAADLMALDGLIRAGSQATHHFQRSQRPMASAWYRDGGTIATTWEGIAFVPVGIRRNRNEVLEQRATTNLPWSLVVGFAGSLMGL
jgi:hypothetical protein